MTGIVMKDGTMRRNVQINKSTAERIDKCQVRLVGLRQRHVTKLEVIDDAVRLLLEHLEADHE